MMYYYHLQMMHIDLLWAQNWLRLHRTGFPSIFELPSRAAKYFYNNDVKYVFEDGRERTLDSHRLVCDECNRQFYCNVNHMHNHSVNKFPPKEEQTFERRTTVPYFEVAGLQNLQRSVSLPLFLPTNQVADIARNKPLTPQQGSFHCEASPALHSPMTTSTMSTIEDSWQQFEKEYHYDVEKDELKKK